MKANPLTKVDLNSLMVLQVLLEERSTTRAAKRLFVTQSAMSKSLQRLRGLFNDPLLVRSGDGLVPTPRAEELAVQLQHVFFEVEKCFSETTFDPASAEGVVRIAAPEQFAFFTIPELVIRLRNKAPNLTVESQHLMENHLEMLTAGSLDFVVNTDQIYPENFSTKHIYSAKPMFWCHNKHPLLNKKDIDFDDVCAYPLITFRAQNITSTKTNSRSLIRTLENSANVILDTTHLLIAIDVLCRTDALMLAPDYLSRFSLLRNALCGRPIGHIPLLNDYRIDLLLLQHKRTFNSPLHRWMSDEIANILSNEDYAEKNSVATH